MRNVNQIFEILGIEPTKSKHKIKKAYAAKVKECHPEERPSEWKRLHQAYEDALAYAAGKATSAPDWQESTWTESTFQELPPIQSETEQTPPSTAADEPEHESQTPLDYDNLFEDINKKTESDNQHNITIVLRQLSQFSHQREPQSHQEWLDLLNSSAFQSCCEEEIVLFNLEKTLSDVLFSRKTAELIIDRLEELHQKLVASMDTYKAGLAQKAQYVLLEKYKQYMSFEEKVPYQPSQKPKRKSRIFPIFAAVFAVLAIVVFATVKLAGSGTRGPALNEYEAQTELAQYLKQKYPEMKVEADNITLYDYSIYSRAQGASINSGYYGYLKNDSDHALYILAWKEDGKTKTVCFDDYQTEQINADLKTTLLEELGLTEGEVFLSNSGATLISEVLRQNTACFNTIYDGSLTGFFQEEAALREELMSALIQLEILESHPTINPNGRCTVYLKDPQTATIAERLENPDSSHLQILETVLGPKAEDLKFQIEAVVFPQEHYDKVFLAAQQDEYLLGTLREGGTYNSSSAPPFAAPLVTAWYQSTDLEYEGQLYVQTVEKASEGIYLVDGDSYEAKPAKGSSNYESRNILLERTSESPCYVKETTLPAEAATFLKENNIPYTTTQNYTLTGPNKKVLMVLVKDQLGIPDSRYTVLHSKPETEYSEAECEQIEVGTKIKDQTASFYSDACDESGYLIVGFYVRSDGSMVTVAY